MPPVVGLLALLANPNNALKPYSTRGDNTPDALRGQERIRDRANDGPCGDDPASRRVCSLQLFQDSSVAAIRASAVIFPDGGEIVRTINGSKGIVVAGGILME